MSEARMAMIRERIEAALVPENLEIRDDSHLHAGHAGARDGRGHFAVSVVAAAFEGKAPLARHRLVYGALGDLMTTDIHALIIDARTPAEASS
ncbi:MAG: BolA family protein [Pseudomonadota bacterium]